jgi:hypothetical protein
MIFSVLGPRVSVTTRAQSPGRSGKRLSTAWKVATALLAGRHQVVCGLMTVDYQLAMRNGSLMPIGWPMSQYAQL